MNYAKRLEELNIVLPQVAAPVAAYVPAVKVNDMVYTAGQVAFVEGELKHAGRLGETLSVEEGAESARLCVLNALAAAASVAGGVNNIEKIVRLAGYVNSANDFTDQAKVMNGASRLMLDIFGDAGRHARSAIGVNVLPLGASVEVELIVKVS